MSAKKQSASERLATELDRRKIGPTELGRLIGVQYQTVRRWICGDRFPADKRRAIVDALKLADDFFDEPEAADARAEARKLAFAEFLAGPYGQAATPRECRFLERLVPDDPEFDVSAHWYDLQLALVRNCLSHEHASASAKLHKDLESPSKTDKSRKPRR